jgi:hypothetical protein
MNDGLRGIFEIATALIGVAVLALLLNPQAKTVDVVRATGGTFNDLLKTVTLQNGMGFSTQF